MGVQLSHIPLAIISLEELYLYTHVQLRRIDIVAPVLKTLKFNACDGFDNEFTLTFSAPLVDNLSWRYPAWSTNVRFGVMWFMSTLDLETPNTLGLMHCPRDYILLLNIEARDNLGNVAQSFEEEISRIPVRNLAGLELQLETEGHVYGAMVLDLLGLCSSIKKLRVTLNPYGEVVKTCFVNCPCDQPDNWRSQIVPLTDLKEVCIEGFEGEEHEIALLKVLLRYAAKLETVNINFFGNVPQSCSAYMELPSILKAHPSVNFKICRLCGDQVLF